MDLQSLVEQLLQSGRELASRGVEEVEKRAGIPEEGKERDAMLSGMGKGALAAGVLALLLGTGGGRKLTGSALKLGSLAALGGIAYKAYQNWQAQQGGTPVEPARPVNQLAGPEGQQRSLSLIKAMIAAAKADGHIDENERARINAQIQRLDLDDETFQLLKAEIDKPLDVTAVAALADSTEAAAEIYLASLVVIDAGNAPERDYLNALAQALKLPPELVAQLRSQAAA